ncbi:MULTISPECIES: peptide chain release factor N(5)-glutamine methyltransferase [Dyella]|uniref:Release factor glutamine methyltransferase n=2 Tax=Dyella TaxID=231454 RepID=A0A4R0YK95_9GAMM|nr:MULTISPECIES: peptide chain release factor N(5)-glutamine methyltransferase [Dyella]TBR37082.1 peptide chain release factor N(5)-glutamine methyltransferase [Dyella terrae]TCI07828.1 peptide chain release factor N(5)-glutamine methyltransferase [Dyella soli]
MPDIRQALAEATRRLGERVDAELLLLHVVGKPRSWLIAHDTDVLDDATSAALDALIERRAGGEPVAYITGRRGFWKFDLQVSPATLIPRPETELLVELALERLPKGAVTNVLDLGTGSGAIALAIAHERQRARVTAVDISGAALEVATRNAVELGVRNICFAQGSWFEPVLGEPMDLIVSNPPYIEAADPHLIQGDLRFEPANALASGTDGLDAIRELISKAPGYLRPGKWLLMEHGWNQGPDIRQLLRDAGYEDVATYRDLEGRDRVSGGRSPG